MRRLQAFLVLGVWIVAMPAAAQASTAEFPAEERPPAETSTGAAAPDAPTAPKPESAPTPADPPPLEASTGGGAAPPPPTAEDKPTEKKDKWDMFLSGYFRAPMAIGISNRPSPDDMNGPSYTQYSYGPNRTIDSNYYSFAYTRLQEQDWVELFVHAKKKHVEAVVGWMGYWFQGVGFRNNDAAWAPGLAYLTLDTDFEAGGVKPNIAFTAGAWWPKFGYVEKYDTYTLGQYRQLGEQLKLKIPFNDDLTVTLVQGFGTGRDGIWNFGSPPPYQSRVGLDLLHYEHVGVSYKELVDVGLHFNYQWTRDPNLHQQATTARGYTDAREAKFSTFGAEANVRVPRAGRLWISPSYTRLRNGWALSKAGIEIMHSISGEGFATNYLAWSGDPPTSTGTGSSFNLGFLYENTLSGVLGREQRLPEVKLSVFGLFIDANQDFPTTTTLTKDHLGQMKYGVDVLVQTLDWLGLSLRWDEVNLDLDETGYVFSAISPRVTFSSHFLSGESIYLQYSRYRYGDNMVLDGTNPWRLPLVPGSEVLQTGPYRGEIPDMDVIRLQASVAF